MLSLLTKRARFMPYVAARQPQIRWLSTSPTRFTTSSDDEHDVKSASGEPVKAPNKKMEEVAHGAIETPQLTEEQELQIGSIRSYRRYKTPDFIHDWSPEKFRNYGVMGSALTAGLIYGGMLSPLWFAPWAAYGYVGFRDMRSHTAIRRNFPVLGNFRYLSEMVRPEIQQYFIENDQEGKPFSRQQRSIVYRRAKNESDTTAFGTIRDVYGKGHEWVQHSIWPQHCQNTKRVIGEGRCSQPYEAKRFNISAMSYGALSSNAVLALNLGAAASGCYHNTGEGSVSPHHLKGGGDIVWNVGTGYFGCRTMDGDFDPILFSEKAAHPNIKMIEVKVSQGAKPGHGGMLPAGKITEEIAEIRHIPMGKDCVSPPAHSAFGSPRELMKYIKMLRELSGGKPVGLKICMGRTGELMAILRAAAEGKDKGEIFDFITIDGAEGGTGAAPNSFVNRVGAPLSEALALTVDALRGLGIRDDVAVICSGKVLSGYDVVQKLAIGADVCNSARGMMFALGCIQSLRCDNNSCPTGITTNVPRLENGLVVADKWKRVYYYQKRVSHDVVDLLGAAGCEKIDDVHRGQVMIRRGQFDVLSYEELWPTVEMGCLIENGGKNAPKGLKRIYDASEQHIDKNPVNKNYDIKKGEGW